MDYIVLDVQEIGRLPSMTSKHSAKANSAGAVLGLAGAVLGPAWPSWGLHGRPEGCLVVLGPSLGRP